MRFCCQLIILLSGLSVSLRAAPVDLTPPRNVLGYADENGYFRIIQRYGEIKFSDGFDLPLRFEFWTGRSAAESKSAFGWDGWHCGPLESTADFYGGNRYLKATLLCAKVLFLEKSDTEENTYYTLNKSWKGVVTGDLISISREDGWDLRFVTGKVSSLRTDSGILITWHRGVDGKLDRIAQTNPDAADSLKVIWNEDRTIARQLILPDETLDFSYDHTSPPARVMKVSLTDKRETRTMTWRLIPDALEITEFDGVIRRFDWTLDKKQLVSDGLNRYKVRQADDQSTIVEMETATGKSLSRQSDVGKGITIATDASGVTHRIHRIADDSVTHRFISHIDRLVGEKYILVMKNTYDKHGTLIERQWLGSPFMYRSFVEGKVEECLTPEREVTFHSDPLVDLETYSTIKYSFDPLGNHTETTVNGEAAILAKWDPQSRLLYYRAGTRFEQHYSYLEDGSKVESVKIPGVTDRKFGFLNAPDESITAELVIEKTLDTKGRLVKKRLLDQTTHTYTYDDLERMRSLKITAGDGKTLVTETSYVYQPQNHTALMIEKDHMNGETRYYELAFEPNGKFKKGKRITAIAAANQF